jgi:hypothetical protein
VLETDKCTECEKEIVSDLADLQMKYDKAEKYIKLLNACLDVKEKLCEFYRQENGDLKEKLSIYER